MPRIRLYLLNPKGLAVLRAVVDAGHAPAVERVVVGRDAAQEDSAEAILELAAKHGIAACERLQAPPLAPGLFALCVGWRWLVHGVPPHQLIVFHDSLLPRYRGFAPLVNMLINGEQKLGVTALFGAAEYDRGDIIAQQAVEIRYPLPVAEAIERLIPLYQSLARQVVACIAAGETLPATPQDEALASYSIWRDAEDFRVDWHQPAETIARFVDAVGPPYAGAECRVQDLPARLLRATPLPDVRLELRHVGKVVWMDEGRPVVVCGKGLLRVDELYDAATGTNLLPLARFRTRFR